MITLNMNKVKDISHEIRRKAREIEFEPLDTIIAKQIPGQNISKIEESRQAIRDKYSQIQNDIDSANNINQIYSIIDNLK